MKLIRSTSFIASGTRVGVVLVSLALLSVCSCAGGGGGGGGAGGGGGDDNANDNAAPGAPAARQDLWTTESTGESNQSFEDTPIPAGFFDFNGRQCGTFDGTARFGGAPISEDMLGAADTLVNRSGDPIAPSDPVGTEGTVDIEIMALNMRSLEPITVMCEGEATEWNVRVELSDRPAQMGSLTATKTYGNGGTALSVLYVMPRLVFTSVDDPTVERVLDVGAEGGEAIVLNATIPWVHAVDPNNPDPETTFILGVQGGGPGALKQDTLIPCVEHFNPTGSHLHNTCAADTDGDGITDGVDNCRFDFNPDQEDEDGDTFGDVCDPCPDDPDCPASGDQCEEICPDLYSEACDLIEPLYDQLCRYFSECICLPPDCDPDSYGGPSEWCLSEEMFSEDLLAELESTGDEFVSLGCDRCSVLDPCPPPPCDFPDTNPCAFVDCPDGRTCDPETVQCCDPLTGDCCDYMAGECVNLCDFIICPDDRTCDPNTQECCDLVTGECCDYMAGECF
ncbi:MAG: hypothetical protein ACYTFA_16505 [Planctomycetota bacterium]|jgi:hypothetical protein